MATCRTEVNEHGLHVIHLENDHLLVSLIPQAGGKISAITDKRSGRNWLWSNPYVPIRIPDYGGDFGLEQDSGGWDEILFSVDPCEIRIDDSTQLSVPDHGDLVGQSWNPVAAGESPDGHAVCRLSARGRAADYDWQRDVRVDAARAEVVLNYELKNTGNRSWPFFWCAHPLLAVDNGMTIRLPRKQEFSVNKIAAEGLQGATYDWPHLPLKDGRLADLANSFHDSSALAGEATKVFVRSSTPGVVSIITADDRERLTLEYDDTVMPWLGIWINNKGWSGCGSEPYENLGIEPATAPHDSLQDAINAGHTVELAPGDKREWSVTLRAECDG